MGIKMKLYDKKQIDRKNILFDNKTLFWLIMPIVLEQFFNSLMGVADTVMVTTVGSEAISGVALVESINNLVIQMFSAMAAGDVKFPMIVSICSMWGCRVMLCNFLVKMFQFGLIAVWLGMFADWTIRAAIFSTQFLSGKWIHGGVVTKKELN